MKRNALYRMGEFIEVDDPIEWDMSLDLSADLLNHGYKCGLTIGNEDFPYVQIWEGNVFNKSIELVYPFFGLIEMQCLDGRDLYFENWINVLHFLQNYTGWIKNLIEIEKGQLEIQELFIKEEKRKKALNIIGWGI